MPKGIYQRTKEYKKSRRKWALDNNVKPPSRLGSHHSEKSKEKIRLKKKGIRVSPETEFKKGQPSWNKGTKYKIGKVSNSKGRHYSPKTEWKKGEHSSLKTEFKKGMTPWNKGKECLEIRGDKNPAKRPDVRKKMSEAQKGEKAWNWKGGISFEPYGVDFNKQLKEQTRKRDNYHCQECFRHQDELRTRTNRKYKLHIHHIDYNKQNNSDDNLISLCRNCHLQTNFKRENWTNYFKNKTIWQQ